MGFDESFASVLGRSPLLRKLIRHKRGKAQKTVLLMRRHEVGRNGEFVHIGNLRD